MIEATSIFLPRYKASGITAAVAYNNYLEIIQEAENWRSVADELFRPTNAYQKSFFKPLDDQPISFWNELIDCVFGPAFEFPQDREAIRRVYAFSEWCRCQTKDQKADPAIVDDVRLYMFTCFYEALPTNSIVLTDMKNWFSCEEIDVFMLQNPFMAEDVDVLKKTFGMV